jgi:hypothetical protein
MVLEQFSTTVVSASFPWLLQALQLASHQVRSTPTSKNHFWLAGTFLQQVCLMDDSGERIGFNAAVAGCFFALEFVLRFSTTEAVPSLTTAMLLLSSVLANVVS